MCEVPDGIAVRKDGGVRAVSEDQEHKLYPWTPGPWAVNRNTDGEFPIDTIGPEGQENYNFKGGVGWQAWPCPGDAAIHVSEADAQLIALAPEMAEAILSANTWLVQNGYVHIGLSTVAEKLHTIDGNRVIEKGKSNSNAGDS